MIYYIQRIIVDDLIWRVKNIGKEEKEEKQKLRKLIFFIIKNKYVKKKNKFKEERKLYKLTAIH